MEIRVNKDEAEKALIAAIKAEAEAAKEHRAKHAEMSCATEMYRQATLDVYAARADLWKCLEREAGVEETP